MKNIDPFIVTKTIYKDGVEDDINNFKDITIFEHGKTYVFKYEIKHKDYGVDIITKEEFSVTGKDEETPIIKLNKQDDLQVDDGFPTITGKITDADDMEEISLYDTTTTTKNVTFTYEFRKKGTAEFKEVDQRPTTAFSNADIGTWKVICKYEPKKKSDNVPKLVTGETEFNVTINTTNHRRILNKLFWKINPSDTNNINVKDRFILKDGTNYHLDVVFEVIKKMSGNVVIVADILGDYTTFEQYRLITLYTMIQQQQITKLNSVKQLIKNLLKFSTVQIILQIQK